MPRWIYTRPPENCHETELKVACKLNQLPDSWIVRWGFYYDDNGTSREGDFLIQNPDGCVLVMEVKTVLRLFSATGRWEGEQSADSPKTQLDSEWAGVLREFQRVCTGVKIPFIGKALCVPGESISSSIPTYQGIPRSELIDQHELAHFMVWWNQHFHRRTVVSPPEAQSAFLQTYGGTLCEIRGFIKETDAILLRQLSLDYELLDMLSDNHQMIVSGGVGSGKTWMALEQANRIAKTGKTVLFLCYNLQLAALLKQLVEKRSASPGSVVVMAWEEIVRDIFSNGGIPWDPPAKWAKLSDKNRFYSEEVPFLVCELMRSPERLEARYDALIVDEAQDHDTEFPESVGERALGGWWQIYRALLRNGDSAPIGIYLDPAQRPYFRPDSFSLEELKNWLPRATKVKLLKTLRYTRQVMGFLRQLQSDSTSELIKGLFPGELVREGPVVESYQSQSADTPALIQEIISKWIAAGFCRSSEILILSRHGNPLDYGCLKGITKIGEWSLGQVDQPGDLKVSSFNKAKGLDSLAVIMIDTKPFEDLIDIDQVGYWMAASRARQLLAVIHTSL